MEFHLGDLLECVADAVPDREALACGDRRLSYRRLDERATQLAHALADAGVAQGDHVGLYLYNGAEFIESLIAVFKIRAVPINVNYRYVDSELRYLFDNADAVAVIHQREFAPRLATIVSDLPKLRICVCVEDSSGADLSRLRPLDYEQVLAEGSPERNFGPRSSGDLYIAYTGGTTGLPKGVMWRHEDLLFGALMGGNPWGEPLSRPEEIAATAASAAPFCALPAAPLMHVAAQWTALIYLLGGAKVVLSPGPGFDPDRIWRLVEQEKVQALSIVGDAMARPLADALARPGGDYDTSSLMVIGSGGATFSPAVKAQLAE
ncbi:MAG: acyl-CoA synthetase, partial [Deltaproteobacteria bacterium]